MKKILISFWVMVFVALGLTKIADLFDTSIKKSAVESERSIASNGRPESSDPDRSKSKRSYSA